MLYSLNVTCRLNGVDPETWLRYVIGHIQDWPVNRVRDLRPWKGELDEVSHRYTQQLAEGIMENGIFIGGGEQDFYRLHRYAEKHYAWAIR